MTRNDTPDIDWSLAETWYDDNADAFEMASLNMEPSPFLKEFAARLPAKARVLDAGCGAGRDSCWLLGQKFQVGAFDISKEMVAAARDNTRHRVEPRWLDFRDYGDPPGSWDGIWALASLLHLPRAEVEEVLPRLIDSLTEDGVLAFAVKRGSGEKMDSRGRPMSFFELEEILDLTRSVMPKGSKVEAYISECPDSSGTQTEWINITATRSRPF